MDDSTRAFDRTLCISWIIILALLIRSSYLLTLPTVNAVYKYAALIILIFNTILYIRRYGLNIYKSDNLFWICGLIILLPYLIRMVHFQAVPASLWWNAIYLLALATTFYFGFERNSFEKLTALNIVLDVYLCINAATIILYPDGLYANTLYTNNWFLGYKNELIYIILPAVCIEFIMAFIKKGRYTIKSVVMYVIALWSIVTTGSTTSLVILILFGILVLILGRRQLPRWFSLRNIFIVIAIVSIGIVAFGWQNNFEFIVVDILQKDLSFTGRTVIWSRAVSLFQNAPVLGYGIKTTTEWRSFLAVEFYESYFSHPHNYILYILLQGGLILFVAVVWYWFKVGKTAIQNKEQRGCSLLIFMFLCFLVMGISESMNTFYLLYPIALLMPTIGSYE